MAIFYLSYLFFESALDLDTMRQLDQALTNKAGAAFLAIY